MINRLKSLQIFSELNRFRRLFQRIGIVFGALILLFQFSQSIISIRSNEVIVTRPVFFIIAILLLLLSSFQQMVAWKLILRALSVDIPIGSVVQSYALTFLPRYIPGTVWGYISRSEWLLQKHGISYKRTVTGSILETLIAVISCVFLVSMHLVLQTGGTERLIILFGIVLVLCLPSLTHVFLKRGYENHGTRWYVGINLSSYISLIGSIMLFIANNYFYGVALWLIYQGLIPSNVLISFSSWLAYSASYSLAWLVGFFVVFVPTGMGIRELVLTNLLIGGVGISSGQAVTAAVFLRLCILLSEILWVIVGILIGKWREKMPVGELE